MKKQIVCILLTGLLFAAPNLFAEKNRGSDFLDGFTSNSYRPVEPAEVYHCNDGLHYTTLSNDGLFIVKYEYASGRSVDTLFNINTIRNCPVERIYGYSFAANEEKILVHTQTTPIYRRSFTTNYYVYYVSRRVLEPLSENGPQQLAQFSPNGRLVAFVRDNNLYLKKLDYNSESAITTDGETNKIRNGMADWVYEEEFGLTRYFEWSSDSKLLAFVRFDESEVKEFSFQWMNQTTPSLVTYKYPQAGQTNSTVSVHVYDIQNRSTKLMQVGQGNDIYFSQLTWSNNPEELAIVKLNRDQTKIELLSVNAKSGVAKPLFIEQSKSYLDYSNLNCLTFLEDNSFICMSERDGYRHLYLFQPSGIVARQLTKGEWDVMRFYGYDPQNKATYYLSDAVSPTERHVYRADAKGNSICLDKRHGMHSASFSKGFKYAIHQFNNCMTPNIYSVINQNGKKIRVIEDNKALAETIEKMNLPRKEFFTIETQPGLKLNAWMVRPNEMDSSRQYPLIMVQYSGPNSQEVLNRWRPDWEYYMAQRGYIVACVDGRGTGGRGTEFRTCIYRRLGQLETIDQSDAARLFGRSAQIDSSRIAIWGWSYGGFMTLMSLTNGNGAFSTGIAIAPVTDWALYNTAYTERYMSRPQENAQGYQKANLIDQAANLKGNLLIVHGSADDNVHTQNTYLYTQQLVEEGKPFSEQIYTNKNHSILGAKTRKHLYELCTRFIEDNL